MGASLLLLVQVECDQLEWRQQYQEFWRKMAMVNEQKGSSQFTSMDIMVKFMKTEDKLYQGCEAVMNILTQAATIKTVESVVESWISVLEHHANKSRPLKSESIHSEMMVAINGPLLQHSQGVVSETMKAYWGQLKKESLRKGHFTRRGGNVKSWLVSNAVDALNKVPVKNVFLM